MTERSLTAVGPEDDDYREDAEERREDAGETAAAPMEVMLVKLSKHWSELHAAQARAESMDQEQWGAHNVLEPTYPPRGMIWLYRNSNALRQNIEAISHNVHGFDWMLGPVFDFDAENINEQVAVAIYLDRYHEWEDGGEEGEPPGLPSEDDVVAAVKKWRTEMAMEKARVTSHFDSCCFEQSFIDLRKASCEDKEVIGWGAWEVVRANGMHGPPRRYLHVHAHRLRLQRLSGPILVDEKIKVSSCHYRTIKVWRRFRKIVMQEDDTGQASARYFRQFGDPRVISSSTGTVYRDTKALTAAEGEDAAPAHEILWFSDYFPGSAYGAPRYHGVIPELKGMWLASNHTVDYLENSAIPRGLLLVNDGRLNKRSVKDIRNFFGTVKGKAENRIGVIQAETPRDKALEGTGRVQMEWVDLTKAQREDSTFSKYSESGQNIVAQSYRLPPLLRGETRDFNRSTANAAMHYAEEQVFSPDRTSFDWIINHTIFPALGVRFWRFRSRGPAKQDPEVISKVLEVFLKQGVMVPAEARQIAERVLSVDLLRMAGDWQQIPLVLTQQGFKAPETRRAPGEQEQVENPPNQQLGEEKEPDVQTESDSDGGEVDKDVVKGAEALTQLRQMVGEQRFDALVDAYVDSHSIDEATIQSLFDDTGSD